MKALAANPRTILAVLTAATLVTGCETPSTTPVVFPTEVAVKLQQAHIDRTPIPLASIDIPKLTLAEAYDIQREFVGFLMMSGPQIVGYKMGVTSTAAQRTLSINAPLAGALLDTGVHFPGTPVKRSDFRVLKLETEIGYVINQDITRPIQSANEIPALIAYVVPVIELPDAAFSQEQPSKGVDVAAGNVAAAGFIPGDTRPLQGLEVNGIQPTMYRDGEAVYQGDARESMGDQWEALRWLINNRLSYGWPLERGYLLITGALGEVLDGAPGDYRADYGPLGEIQFTIVE